MTSSVFIRLAGPLQSWAKPSLTGNYVSTSVIPTATALQGLVAGGLGYQRRHWPEWIFDIDFIVREERIPSIVNEFQTIGSREDEYRFRHRLSLMQGINSRQANPPAFKPGVAATTVSRRTYLADSEFIVQMTKEGHTEELDQAVSNPVFANYLGRKAFCPSFPFYLGVGNADEMSRIPHVHTGHSESKQVNVFQYFLGMGNNPQPTQISVPAVSKRSDWFAAMDSLGFKRRKTLK